jgi:hypothetical protein
MEKLKRTAFPKSLSTKERIYVLIGDAPLTYALQSKDNHSQRLMYLDPETEDQRPLRYARNFPTPFIDEQEDSKAILEQVVFSEGVLTVPAENKALQFFLHVHPKKNELFRELDPEAEANFDIADLDRELEADIMARDLSLAQIEMFGRQLLGYDVTKKPHNVIHRDLRVYARNHPESFLELADDPDLKRKNVAKKAIEENWLQFRNKGRDVFYNFPDNKSKLLTVPLDEDGYDAIVAYFLKPEGQELYKMLEMELR